MLIFISFAPLMRIIFVISTSNNSIVNKIYLCLEEVVHFRLIFTALSSFQSISVGNLVGKCFPRSVMHC